MQLLQSFAWRLESRLELRKAFTSEDESAGGKKSAKEAGEEAPILPRRNLCRQRGTNPLQFVPNVLQFDGVDIKNGVKYVPRRFLCIHELTCLHILPNG